MAGKGDNIAVLWKIMQALDEEQVESGISEAMETLLKSIGAESGAVWIKNPENKHIYCIVSVGEDNLTGFSIEYGQGLVGKACESTEMISIPDAANDERFPAGKDEITGIEMKNVFFVPMTFRKESVGCIEIINRTGDDEFNDDDRYIMHSLAGLIPMVVEEKGVKFEGDTEKKVIMSLRGVKKDYPSGMDVVHILKGVDLDVYENELLVILGESGCGKSTLLNIIGGMDCLSEGSITVDGKDFSHPTEKELVDFRRDSIGFIFQSYNLMPNLTALENVRFIAEICKNPGDPEEAIAKVGLTDRAGNYPSMMSGGQQQRVSIARAIVKNPRIILADEPTAALDFTTGQEVLVLIEELIASSKTSVVMVTHNVEIAKMANRVVRVRNGKISSIRINSWPMKAADIVW